MQLVVACREKRMCCGLLVLCWYGVVLVQGSPFSQQLYGEGDSVRVLNASSLRGNLHHSPTAWAFEFFSSWCGHCVAFAPVWKELALRTKDWERVIRVGGMDCALEENNGACREFEVLAYPTVRLFAADAAEKNLGEALSPKGGQPGPRDVPGLLQAMVAFVQDEQEAGRAGEQWPSLLPLQRLDGEVLQKVWSEMPLSVSHLVVVAESLDSYLGRTLSLDMDRERAQVQVRWLPLQQDGARAKVLLLHRDNPHLPYRSLEVPKNYGGLELKQMVFRELGLVQEPSSDSGAGQQPPQPTITTTTTRTVSSSPSDLPYPPTTLYLADLEMALRYSLTHEVTLHKHISGEALQALKNYVRILIAYFPSRPEVLYWLESLGRWVSEHKSSSVSGEELQAYLAAEESRLRPWEHSSNEWVGCKGSQPHLRGYSCGMWMTFHKLTVASGVASEQQKQGLPPVLPTILGYVKHFFGCEQCSKHFQQMAVSEKMPQTTDLARPSKEALWLWRAHNIVNQRLSGEPSEDPVRPKGIFPSTEACPKCRVYNGAFLENITWDEEEVWMFLRRMYSQISASFLGLTDDNTVRMRRSWREQPSSSSEVRPMGGVSSSLFSLADVSLCLVLYVASAAILTLLFLRFALHRSSISPIGLRARGLLHRPLHSLLPRV